MSEKFLERLEFEEDIEVQVGILRYLVAQDCEHILFVRHSSPKHIFGIHLINLLKLPMKLIQAFEITTPPPGERSPPKA